VSAPHGWHDWLGVTFALFIMGVGTLIITDVRQGAEWHEFVGDVVLAALLAVLASTSWAAWSYLRRYDRPGYTPHLDPE
jgi:hypothetical protein